MLASRPARKPSRTAGWIEKRTDFELRFQIWNLRLEISLRVSSHEAVERAVELLARQAGEGGTAMRCFFLLLPVKMLPSISAVTPSRNRQIRSSSARAAGLEALKAAR